MILLTMKNRKIKFRTNRAGGLLGGISNGEEDKSAVKPTPTAMLDQDTVDVDKEYYHKFTSCKIRHFVQEHPVCEVMVRIAHDAIYI